MFAYLYVCNQHLFHLNFNGNNKKRGNKMHHYFNKTIAILLSAAMSVTTHTGINPELKLQSTEIETDTQAVESNMYESETITESESEESLNIEETESETEEKSQINESASDLQEKEMETKEESPTAESGIENESIEETENQLNSSEIESTEEGQTEEMIPPDTQIAEINLETETALDIETVLETETISTEIDVDEEILRLREEFNSKLEADGYIPSGYIDSGIEAELQPEDQQTSFFSVKDTVPEKYLAMEHGQTTSIKNQGGWGSCWAFAAVAAAESAYKKITQNETDMSETHLINFLYHDNIAGPDGGLEGDAVIPLMTTKVDNGGNNMFTTFAMTRWTGIADEQTDKSLVYPSEEDTKKTKELNIPQEYAYTDIVHLQNSYWMNKTDMDSVKKAIMEYGIVATYYKHDELCSSNYVDKDIYNGPTAYYNYQDYGTGHAVAIVGWDDNFDKNNFKYTAINQDEVFINAGISYIPKNNGAWLIKNSWGTDYGDDGYFWMSYEDASLSDTMFVFDFEESDNYDHIYQYDGSAGVRYESGEAITTAAVYSSTGNQMIEAVGVGIASANTNYLVEVYSGLADKNNPQSGKLCSRAEGNAQFQGFYTIRLDEYVSVAEGENFGIVVQLSGGSVKGEKQSAIFMDQSYDNGKSVRFVAHTNPNETFLKTENGWQDAVDRGTYRIKAYTSDSEFDVPQENRLLTPEMVKEIEDQEYNGTQNEPDIEISYMGEPLIKDIDFNVTYSNNSKAADKTESDAPKALITGIGKYTGTVEQAFTITKKSLEDEMLESVETTYNGTIQDDLTLKNGEILLVKGNDYQIAFNKQPYNAGNYTATVTGINNYTGELIVPYTITKTTIVEDAIIVPEQVVYTGTTNKVPIQVTVNGAELPASNYSVSYKNNTNVGTATVTITGKGNCQGKVTKTFAILPKSIEAEDFTMTVADKIYSGKELLPSVSVKWGKKTLKKGKDYTIVYANNILAAEKAETDAPKVIVTGVGNYQGTREIGFTIMPKEIAESSISAQISYCESKENSLQTDSDTMPAQIENSMQTDSDTMDRLTENNLRTDSDTMAVQIENDLQTDSDTMAVQIENSLQTDNHVKDRQTENSGSNIRVLIGKTELNTNQYDMVVYNAGTTHIVEQSQLVLGTKYDIQITLKGNYRVKGKTSALKKNIICKRDISNLDILLKESNAVYTYNAKAQKPQIIVKDENGTVVPKTQYTIAYADNIHAGTAGIIVTGKGDYAGTKQIPFTIQKQRLENLTIQPIKDQTYAQKELRPTVKVLNGKKALKAGEGKDYTYIYRNNIDVAYDNSNIIANAYVEIQLSDNYEIPQGMPTSDNFKIAEGTNNRVIAYFKIVPAKISSISLSNAYYNGQAVLPDKVTVKAGKLVVPSDSYEITANQNVNVSAKAQLTIAAKPLSNYTGNKTKKYRIVKLEMKKMLLPVIPDQPYIGQPVDVSHYPIKLPNGEEIGKEQYTITIKNNHKLGKASITYKAASEGLYKGSVTVKFNIVKATMLQAIDFEAAKKISKPYTGEEQILTENELREFAPIKGAAGEYKLPYTVTYSKNTNAGQAIVRLKGNDYLQGSINMHFTITPKSSSIFKITTGEKQLSYNNGTPVYLELKEVSDGDKVLQKGRDYTYTYVNADKKGTACLTISGVGNYTGTRYVYYSIR